MDNKMRKHLQTGSAQTRRKFVKRAAAFSAVVGSGLFSTAAFAAKKSKQKLVKYQEMPKNKLKCADCTFFEAAEKTCKVVEGTINPEGWCLRFVKKKA